MPNTPFRQFQLQQLPFKDGSHCSPFPLLPHHHGHHRLRLCLPPSAPRRLRCRRWQSHRQPHIVHQPSLWRRPRPPQWFALSSSQVFFGRFSLGFMWSYSKPKWKSNLHNPLTFPMPVMIKSGTRKREDSWVISLFVVLHIVAFAATMFVNDCWQNSHRDCAIKVLGRLSFQPLWENPLLGPSSSTWVLFPFFLSWEFSLLIPIAVWLLRKSDKRKNECWRRGGGFLFFFLSYITVLLGNW